MADFVSKVVEVYSVLNFNFLIFEHNDVNSVTPLFVPCNNKQGLSFFSFDLYQFKRSLLSMILIYSISSCSRNKNIRNFLFALRPCLFELSCL